MTTGSTVHPFFPEHIQLSRRIWRQEIDILGWTVPFDIRAENLSDPQALIITNFLSHVQKHEFDCRSEIVKDVPVDDKWAEFCNVVQPSIGAMLESMTLKWVIYSDATENFWSFIVSYHTPLFDVFSVSGWYGTDGQFLHAEIE